MQIELSYEAKRLVPVLREFADTQERAGQEGRARLLRGAATHIEQTEIKLHTVEADRKLAMKRIDELEAKIKQEFDIATGYHSRWQRAEKELEQAQLRLEQGRALLDALANQPLIDEMHPDLREGDFEAGYETFVTKCRELRGLLFPAAVEGTGPDVLRCMGGCGTAYSDFGLDVVLPDEQWKAVSGRADGSGVMCAACIVKRGSELPGVTVAKLHFPDLERVAERQGPSKCWWPDCPCHQQSDCPFREAADVEDQITIEPGNATVSEQAIEDGRVVEINGPNDG